MSENPESYVVVDARSRKCFAPDPPFHLRGIIAIDLPQDLWRDFSFFVEEARKSEGRGDAEHRYRFLRASLMCLFAHINAFFDLTIEAAGNDPGFQSYKRTVRPTQQQIPNWQRSEHGRFVFLFTDYVKRVRKRNLPEIDWTIKPLRNLLAHPAGSSGVSVADLYDLDIDALVSGAKSFEKWIVAAAAECGIEYEIDTASLASKMAEAITGTATKRRSQRF